MFYLIGELVQNTLSLNLHNLQKQKKNTLKMAFFFFKECAILISC